MKQRKIFSRFFNEQGRQYSLTDMAKFMAAFYFDMRTVHFCTTGNDFYTYHQLAEELYTIAEMYYDDLIETAIGYDEEIKPMFVIPEAWCNIQASDISGAETEEIISKSLMQIFDKLESIAKGKYSSFVYSKIDSMLEYFDKEIYKIKQNAKN